MAAFWGIGSDVYPVGKPVADKATAIGRKEMAIWDHIMI